MQKLKLDLDALAVESFDAVAPTTDSAARGTVDGYDVLTTVTEKLRDYLSIAFCAAQL